MKSKRRQELKSNDLAHALEQVGPWLKDWGFYAIGGLAVVFIAMIIFTYMKSARQTAMDESYLSLQKELSTAANSPLGSEDELHRTISRIADLGEQSTNQDFKIEAALKRGNMALSIAMNNPGGIDLEFLKDAKSAFEEVVNKYKSKPIPYGRALYGLYQVEANAFAVDGDSGRKAAAAGYLTTLRDDTRLAGVPFQTMAIDRLNEIDELFTKVEFAAKPDSAVQAVISPSQPSSTITLGTPKVVTNDDGGNDDQAPDDQAADEKAADDKAADETGDAADAADDAGTDAAESDETTEGGDGAAETDQATGGEDDGESEKPTDGGEN
ncbi:MAG: hypothetical protein R3E58_20480 [Phycisphaerae bacterium]|nr:hypothetical protein [Phycisphaerales bacterium]